MDKLEKEKVEVKEQADQEVKSEIKDEAVINKKTNTKKTASNSPANNDGIKNDKESGKKDAAVNEGGGDKKNKQQVDNTIKEDLIKNYRLANEEKEKWKDQFLRIAAEFDNYKKRSSLEAESRLKFATQSLAKGIIGCIDDLELAIKHIASQKNEIADKKETIKGLDMSLKNFLRVLKENNVLPIEPKGEVFDPSKHEAMSVVENKELPENSVFEVLKKGYTLHDRLIRPAIVKVTKKAQTKD